ncbi:MAG TPA: VOC family protein [Thermodesulfobacteriota bacterium]|nr:VOC family protein [Thermodesulfobacteriota bacterium]
MIPVKIRRLGHVALHVRDIEASVRFYTECLGFQVSDVNEQGIVFLRLPAHTDHHTMNLVPSDRVGPGGPQSTLNHFAFEVDSLDDLRKMKAFLEAKGVTVLGPIRQRGPGSDKTLDFLDPDGNVVQLYCEMDQIGWDGRSRPREEWQRREFPD